MIALTNDQTEMPEGLSSVPWFTSLAGSRSWQQVQDAFANVVGIPLQILDSAGESLSLPSREAFVCRQMKLDPAGAGQCRHYCGRAVGQAIGKKSTIFYKCHAGLVSFAVPVPLGGERNVVILGGHAFTQTTDYAAFMDAAGKYGFTPGDLMEISKTSRIVDGKVLRSASRFLESAGSVVLQNAFQKRESQHYLSQLLTLFDVSTSLRHANTPHEIFALILNTIGVLFDVSSAGIFVLDRRGGTYRSQTAFGEFQQRLCNLAFPSGDGVALKAAVQKVPFRVDEPRELLAFKFPDDIVRSITVFPMLQDDEMIGFVSVYNTDLPDRTVRMISGFVGHAVTAVENQRVKAELRQRVTDLAVLTEINSAVGATVDPEELFRVILDRSTDLIRAEQGSLMIFEEETREFIIRATKGIQEQIVGQFRIKPGEGIAGAVAERGTALIVHDIEGDERFRKKNRPRYRTKSFISIPLKIENRVVGVLNIADKVTGEVFNPDDLALLQTFAAYASVAIERTQLSEKTRELKRISITDPLTGVLNRRYMQERLTEEVDRSHRHGHVLSYLMVDLDEFKEYNDSHGHMAGDEALKTVAQCIRGSLRTIDVVSRFGGDEFTVLLPETKREGAIVIAERIRQEVARTYLPHADAQGGRALTVSIGLSSYPTDADSADALVRLTDRALYSAKSGGKNRVVAYGV